MFVDWFFQKARSAKQYCVFTAGFFSVVLAAGAQAVVVNFDDLVLVPSDPEFPCFCDHPLTNEYESQGMIIDGGFLSEYFDPEGEDTVSGPNYLLGSDYLTIKFIGALPTFVSMFVSASHQEAIFFDVFGSDGLVDEQQTDGYAGPDNDTPYRPNQLMTFTSDLGIAAIHIVGFYNLRASAMIDDITYEYAAVPEPSGFALLCLGLLGVVWQRTRYRKSRAE
jgi:hypothetical protein